MATSAIFIVYVAVCVDDKSVFGYRIFSVVSESMAPTYHIGDLLVTKKVKQEELKPGVIITFISSAENIKGEFNTHRIVGVDGRLFHTKGDANDYTDKEFVRFDDIVGKVIWRSDFIGKIIAWAQQPRNMAIIIIATLILAFCDVGKAAYKIVRIFKKEKPKRALKLTNISDLFDISEKVNHE